MLSDNDFYVIVKLTSGEQLMAVLMEEDDTYVELLSPMTIKTIPLLHEQKEHVTAHPFCQFSDDNVFTIDKKNVLFIKQMHHVFVPHYQRIVAEYEETTLVTRNEDGSVKRAEDLSWEDDPKTIDDVSKKIAMLESLLGREEEEEPLRNYVEGNDTIN
jgi:hypothetical protein